MTTIHTSRAALGKCLVAGTLALAAVLTSTATASAHDCPAGSVCIYDNAGFSGKLAEFNQASFRWTPTRSVPRDRASSMVNRTGLKACAGNRTIWGTSTLWALGSGGELGWVGAGGNDRMDVITLVSSWAPCLYLG